MSNIYLTEAEAEALYQRELEALCLQMPADVREAYISRELSIIDPIGFAQIVSQFWNSEARRWAPKPWARPERWTMQGGWFGKRGDIEAMLQKLAAQSESTK